MKANSWNIAGEEGHQTSQCFPTHFPAKFLLPTELTVVVLATAGLACVDWRGWRVWGSADGQQAGALTMATASTGLFAGEESRGLRPVLLFSRRHNGLNVNTTMRRRRGRGGGRELQPTWQLTLYNCNEEMTRRSDWSKIHFRCQ